MCMGITEPERDPKLDIIKDLLFLMITKAEESSEQSLNQIKELFRELIIDCDNENVKEIIEFLLDQ